MSNNIGSYENHLESRHPDGVDKAQARQLIYEQGFEETDDFIVVSWAATKDYFKQLKEERLGKFNAEMIGNAVERLDRKTMDSFRRFEDWAIDAPRRLVDRASSFRVDSKQAVAGSVAMASISPFLPAVTSEPIPFDQDPAVGQVVANIRNSNLGAVDVRVRPNVIEVVQAAEPEVIEVAEPDVVRVVKPEVVQVTQSPEVEIVPNAPQAEIAPQEPEHFVNKKQTTVNIPLQRHIRPGQTISHMAASILGVDANNREKLNEVVIQIAAMNDIDLEAGEERAILAGTVINLPIELDGVETYTIQKGDKAGVLYESLGWKEAGYSFEQFKSANAIVDENFIRTDWQALRAPNNTIPLASSGVEAVSNPVQEGELAEVIEATPAAVEVEEIATTQLLSKEEAVKAVEDLRRIVESVEAPLAFISSAEHSSVGQSLATEQDEIVEDLVSGVINPAQVQTEALHDIALENGNLSLHDVARLALRGIYQERNLYPSHELISSQADEVIKGALGPDTLVDRIMAKEGLNLDFESETLTNIEARIDAEIVSQREIVEHSANVIRAISSHEIDEELMASLADELILESLEGTQTGDSYYLLTKEVSDGDIKTEVMNYVLSIYQSRGVEALLLHPGYAEEIATQIDASLTAETIELGAFLQNAENELESILTQTATEAAPILASMSEVMPQVSELDDNIMNSILAERVLGATDDTIRMRLLETVATINGTELIAEVENYYIANYAKYGLGTYASPEHIASISESAMRVWVESEIGYSALDAEMLIESEIGAELELISGRVTNFVDEIAEQPGEAIVKVVTDSMNQAASEPVIDIKMIKAVSAELGVLEVSAALYLQDYYERNGAAKYLTDIELTEITKAIIAGERTPESFVGILTQYSGIPSELFPGSMELVMTDYEGQNLRPLFVELGLDADRLLASAFNSHVIAEGDSLVSATGAVLWLGEVEISYEDINFAYEKAVLGRHAVVAPEVTETESEIVHLLEASLDKVRIEDGVNNLDRTTQAVNDWYNSLENDPYAPEGMPEGYVRLPFHDELEGFDLVYTRSAKQANVETYAAPGTIAVALGMSELWHQLIERDYPQYAGSMLRFRDFNSAHHATHKKGRNIDVTTHMTADISEASSGPAMDYVSGDGSENDYNFELNVDYAVALASFNIDGRRAISSILTSDKNLVAAVNARLGFDFMSFAKHHGEHWHVNTNKGHSLPKFSPQSPFDKLPEPKSDLGIGGEYVDIPQDVFAAEHGSVAEVLEEVELEEVGSLREEAEEAVQTTPEPEVKVEASVEQPETTFEQKAAAQREKFLNNLNSELRGVPVERVKELFTLMHDKATARGIFITDAAYAALIAHAWGESRITPEAKGGAGEGGVWQWKGPRALDADGNPADLSTLDSNVEHFFVDAARDSNLLADIQDPNKDLHDMVVEVYEWERPSSWSEDDVLEDGPALKNRSREEQAGTYRWGVAEEVWEDLNS